MRERNRTGARPRYRSDDGFQWKVAVSIYLLLEACAQQMLSPRVYKKAKDTLVESAAKLFLILVLLLAICSESLSAGAYREGEGIRPEGHTCTQLGQESCESGIAFCEWQDAQCTVVPVKSAGLVWLGFGRTVVADIEAHNMLANMVRSG